MRWDVVKDADASGVSATFPYLRGLRDGDIATSRIKQARPNPPRTSSRRGQFYSRTKDMGLDDALGV